MASRLTEHSSWRGLEVLVVSPTPSHPRDHGNRKRIYEVCHALKSRGAAIHFVHYPAEHDWRHERHESAEAAMRAEWDSYQLAPLTRSPHLAAKGEDHTIDEWADRGLTDYLRYACRTRRYDAAIVNYSWMSFALEALPASVFKILDAHDQFSGRRRMLQMNGIDPEFFHTTPQEEAKGLARADLVWAIKDDERRYFVEELKVRDALTLLHADPPAPIWRAAASTDGWLRVGVIGARNNVNRRNIEAFLDAALPVFRRYMAPVRICLAGGAADDFADRAGPNVEIVGRLPEVADFYAGVDVVAAPMAFSTGLKIKVAEALAAGAPLIAHAHASEGFPTEELLHTLPSFEALALALATLAFERAPLAELATKSREIAERVSRQVEVALEATRQRIGARFAERLLIVASAEAVTTGALLHDHLQSAIDGLKSGATLEIFVSQAAPRPVAAVGDRGYSLSAPPRPLALDWLAGRGFLHSVFVDPALHPALPGKPSSWRAITLADLLAARPYGRAYLMTAPAHPAALGAIERIVVRHDAVEIDGGDADALVAALGPRAVVAGAAPARMDELSDATRAFRVAFRRDGRFERLTATLSSDTPPPHLVVLALPGDPVAAALADLAQRLDARARIIDPSDPVVARALALAPKRDDPLFGLSVARALVDLAPPSALTAVIAEAAARAGVPRLTVPRGAGAYGLWRFPFALRPASASRLLQTVAVALAHWPSLNALSNLTSYDLLAGAAFEAGWMQVREHLGIEEPPPPS
jgi:glycosyltransferase involved in cell wall biosynthesis